METGLMKIALICSGSAPSNEKGRYLGITDEHLSPAGAEKVSRLQFQGFYPGNRLVFVSPMRRAMETARLISPSAPLIILKELAPYDYGSLELLTYKEALEKERFQEWASSQESLSLPEGENLQVFRIRCQLVFLNIIQEMEKKEQRSATVVTHRENIAAILDRYVIPRYAPGDWRIPFGDGLIACYDCASGAILRVVSLQGESPPVL